MRIVAKLMEIELRAVPQECKIDTKFYFQKPSGPNAGMVVLGHSFMVSSANIVLHFLIEPGI